MNHIRQKIIYFKLIDRLVDCILICIAIYLGIITESLYHNREILPITYNSLSGKTFFLALPLFLLSISYIERNFLYRVNNAFTISKNIFLICILSFLFMIAIDFLLKANFFFRSTLIFLILYSYLLLFFKRIFIKIFLSSIRREGMDCKNIMIMGYGIKSKELIKFLNDHKEYGLKVASIIDKNYKKISVNSQNGNFNQIHDLVKRLHIDNVFICMEVNNIPKSDAIFNLLHAYGINIHIVSDILIDKHIKKYTTNPRIEDFYGLPSITYNIISVSYYKLVLKNILERLFAFITIVLLLPMMLVITFLISMSSKGSPIFTQKRVGLRGRVFNQYKFRTMILNAENLKKDLFDLNELDGPIFKIKDDPRVTYIGKILRKFSIDELPQFFNVIKGDMNVVGPRPYPVGEVEKFAYSRYYRRHSMKPGITGLWQIKGRDNMSNFDDCIALDLDYIDNWSFKSDIYIALMTLPAIFKGTGR